MSRTLLCAGTALALTALSLGTMLLRYRVLGDEVRRPVGPGSWKVTVAVQGTSLGRARLMTAAPLDLDQRQLLRNEPACASAQLAHRPPEDRTPGLRRVLWAQRPGVADGPFKARAEFHVDLEVNRPEDSPPPATGPYAPPRPGEYLAAEPLVQTHHPRVSGLARELTADLPDNTNPLDVAQALFRHVERAVKGDVRFEGPALSAVTCLEQGRGDRAARSRLLVALLRNRNIPARVVTGLTLAKGPEQQPHYWVEAWLGPAWLPMCPTYRLFGRVPPTFLVFGLGDRPLVAARRVNHLQYAFLVERLGQRPDSADSPARRAFKTLSLFMLPHADQQFVKILLLLPVAALIICVFRNVIGLHSFGTFAPALIGLAFHKELNSLPGILVFVTILLIGWLMRRLLDRYHLLQVPRVSMMLTLIMVVLITLVVFANLYGVASTRYISLFPMIILTGMVERFWTLENEDSTSASFKTLLQTMFIATVIAVVLGRPPVVRQLFCYPETLGLVMAGQLLIGRYTGYRLMELFRFRDFLRPRPPLDRPSGGETVGPLAA